jgi:tripartite-type tricarboxylate transporter receptor subunit TctC
VHGELFKMMAGIDMLHVPYRGGGPAQTDVIAGRAHVYFGPAPGSIEYVRAGVLRPLAITSATRFDKFPELPTVSEFVPGYEASAWQGVGAPKKTPADVIGKLNQAINAVLVDPKSKARLAELGGTLIAGSPADFGKFVADETEKWTKVIKFAGIKAI